MGTETGVRSTCQVDRGYAPRGETPELKVAGSRFSVHMMSTVTNQGKVRWMISTGRMTAAVFIVFLSGMPRRAERKIFLIVDNLSVHEAAAVEAWLQDQKDRLEIFYVVFCKAGVTFVQSGVRWSIGRGPPRSMPGKDSDNQSI